MPPYRGDDLGKYFITFGIALVIVIILSLWKLWDIAIWLYEHVSINIH